MRTRVMERILNSCWMCSSRLALLLKWHGEWHLFSQGFPQRCLQGWIWTVQQKPSPRMMIMMRWVCFGIFICFPFLSQGHATVLTMICAVAFVSFEVLAFDMVDGTCYDDTGDVLSLNICRLSSAQITLESPHKLSTYTWSSLTAS